MKNQKEEETSILHKKSPLVSIIVPAYNSEKTISETIESVLSQSYENWEMIIVDDCSKDGTSNIVEEYQNKEKRIHLIKLKTNSGAATARNTAIENANGRFLAMLDSDDLWKPEKLSKQIDFMIKNEYGFTYTGYETFNNSDEKKRTVFHVPSSINYKQYLKNTIIGNLTVIIDKEIIPDFRIVKGSLEDVLTWMYYLNQGYTAYGLNETLASYRVTLSSVSGNKIKNAKKYYNCLKQQPISKMECMVDEICYSFNAVKKRFLGLFFT